MASRDRLALINLRQVSLRVDKFSGSLIWRFVQLHLGSQKPFLVANPGSNPSANRAEPHFSQTLMKSLGSVRLQDRVSAALSPPGRRASRRIEIKK